MNQKHSSLPPYLRQEIQAWDSIQPIAADGQTGGFTGSSVRARLVSVSFTPIRPGGPVTENDSYDYIGRHLHRQGIPVPEIYSYCREEGWFLVEDLGDRCFQAQCQRQAETTGGMTLYRQALQVLVQMQMAGTRGFSPEWCFDTPLYDASLVRLRECHYFVQAFLAGVSRSEYDA